MVTNWPPTSMALMSRPLLAINRLASLARRSPEVSSACSRAREAAVRAVSAPAKKAAPTRLTTMTSTATTRVMAGALPAGAAQIGGSGACTLQRGDVSDRLAAGGSQGLHRLRFRLATGLR